MGLSRRILPSVPTNGPYCSRSCQKSCHGVGCIISPSAAPAAAAATADAAPLRRSLQLSNFIIAAGCFFAATIFLGLTYYAVLSHRRRRRRPLFAAVGGSFERGDGPHHDAWHVQTVGLDEAVIASIGMWEYKEGMLGGGAECSICLGELADGELVRLLPKCGHAFHVFCIDTWLLSHVSCPLCRAHIADAPPEAADENRAQMAEEGGDGEDRGSEAVSEVLLDSSSAFDPPSLLPSDSGEIGLLHPAAPMVLVTESAPHLVVESGESSMEEEKDASFQEESSTKSKEKQESASAEKSGEKSGSGMGFFFSKNGRARSSILPL